MTITVASDVQLDSMIQLLYVNHQGNYPQTSKNGIYSFITALKIFQDLFLAESGKKKISIIVCKIYYYFF